MSIADWLLDTMKRLGVAGVDSPRRDALVLLEDTLAKERSWVLAHSEYELTEIELESVNKLIERRVNREPLAYIRGRAWFYGRFFEVNPSVLAPRPESESFIELLKKLKPDRVFDIGTGSGCLAITTALEIPGCTVVATDTSAVALAIAKYNARILHATLGFSEADLLKPLIDFDFTGSTIITNLPYVPESIVTSPEITKEPREALFSGEDGLDHYQRFWQQIGELKYKPSYILTESLESQHDTLERLAAEAGYKLDTTDILVQQFQLIS
jgi:release factor glutamine methyltransferase